MRSPVPQYPPCAGQHRRARTWEKQAGFLSQVVCLQCDCLVMEAAVRTLPCCCFCSTAGNGRRQPSAEIHRQLPAPSQLFPELVFRSGYAKEPGKGHRGNFSESPSVSWGPAPAQYTTLREPQLWHRYVCCCICKNVARRVREKIIHLPM